jgi:hypothetical protein
MKELRGLLRHILFEILAILSLCGFMWGIGLGVLIAYDWNVFEGLGVIALGILCLFSMDYWMDKT